MCISIINNIKKEKPFLPKIGFFPKGFLKQTK